MSASEEVTKAIVSAWSTADLDAEFTQYRASSDTPVLHDQKARPETDWPYCVIEVGTPVVLDRMSGITKNTIRRTEQVPVNFRVHAKTNGSNSGKKIASELIDEIKKTFGGHRTSAPATLPLSNMNHVVTLYVTDFSVREDDEHHSWSLQYNVQVDIQETRP